MEGRRVRRFRMLPSALAEVLLGREEIDEDTALPDGAVVTRIGWDCLTDGLVVLAEHPDFGLVPHGGMIPEAPLIRTRPVQGVDAETARGVLPWFRLVTGQLERIAAKGSSDE